MDYVIGTTWKGEHIQFERWLFEAYQCNRVSDPLLLGRLNACKQFVKYY